MGDSLWSYEKTTAATPQKFHRFFFPKNSPVPLRRFLYVMRGIKSTVEAHKDKPLGRNKHYAL